MRMQGRIGRAGGARVKRALGVQAMLEWAFRVEQAQLELPVRRGIDEEGFVFGMEYVLIERAALGCKVVGGQHKRGSYTQADAEVNAATVGGDAEGAALDSMMPTLLPPGRLRAGRYGATWKAGAGA